MEKLKPITIEAVGNGWLVQLVNPAVPGAVDNREAFLKLDALAVFVTEHFAPDVPPG